MAAAGGGFDELTIASVVRETRDAIVVSFVVPESLRDRYRFRAGQFLTLRATIEGDEVRRSYSICSGEDDGTLRVAIKVVAGGTFSTWAHESLEAGMTLAVAPPDGRFVRPNDAGDGRAYVGFAAGSGITPLLSIVATTLAREPQSRFTLVYGNRATSTTMFREELQRLKDRYLSRLALVFVMSREAQEIELFGGRIDRTRCAALFESWVDLTGISAAYVCGPSTMADDVTAALVERGIAPDRIRRERFVAGAPAENARRSRSRAHAAREEPYAIDAIAIFEGRERAFTIARGDETILDAALRAGIDVPYSCKSGNCATCRAIVVTGDVEMDVNYALEDYEVRRGLVLCCQSYPVSETLRIDIDRATQF